MINKFDLNDIYKTLHSTSAECIFFTSALETLTKIEHMLNHKANLHQSERSKPLKNMLPDHCNVKLQLTKLFLIP